MKIGPFWEEAPENLADPPTGPGQGIGSRLVLTPVWIVFLVPKIQNST